MKELEGKWRGVDVLDDEVKKEIKRLNKMAEGMSDRRIQLLEAEGFIWYSFEVQWVEKLDELRAYKEINGDTLVPAIYPANPSLNQHRCYRNYEKLKELEEKLRDVELLDDEAKKKLERLNKLAAGITEERIKLLEAEGFIWDVHSYVWELQFQELQSFIDLNGHAPIMRKKIYDQLASWVNKQRINYRKHLKGQHTTLSEERIKQLNSIRFDWKVAQRSPKRLGQL